MSSRFGIRPPWSLARPSGRTNRSKRYAASCGPAAASGWYCTENAVSAPSASRSSSPSTTSSLRQTWLTVASPYGVAVGRVERGVDREAVVVRGDLDLAGGAVHHRLVDAAVAVVQLVGAEAERPAEELVAEADPEVGEPPLQRALQQLDLAGRWRPGRRGRWRRTARRAPTASTSSRVAVAGSTCTSMPRSAIIRGVFALMPRSSAATVNRFSPTAGHDVRPRRWRPRRPARRRPSRPDSQHPLEQRLGVGLGRGDADPHRAALAQVAGQRAGVDAGDADDALVAQLVVERCAASASWTGTRAGSRTT